MSNSRILIVIAPEGEAEFLIQRLMERGHSATRIGRTHGFLRRGQTTIICGFDAGGAEEVMAAVQAEYGASTHENPDQDVPPIESPLQAEPKRIHKHDSVSFVIPCERIEKF